LNVTEFESGTEPLLVIVLVPAFPNDAPDPTLANVWQELSV
jgi:hypothetical protein